MNLFAILLQSSQSIGVALHKLEVNNIDPAAHAIVAIGCHQQGHISEVIRQALLLAGGGRS